MRATATALLLTTTVTVVLLSCVQSSPVAETETKATTSCNVLHEFKCADGTKCIAKNEICDGNPDCPDSSDEAPVMDCENYVANCTIQQFRCDNNRTCLSAWDLCNGIKTCSDESDEKYCKTPDCGHPDLYQCKITGKCIPKYKICNDDYSDCGEGDISDEFGCWILANDCPEHTFACMVAGRMRCKNNWNRCDGFRDCEDALDELNCPPRFENGTYCEPSQFECKNHLCITLDQICDKNDDCLDGQDELPEMCDAKIKVHHVLQQHLTSN